MRSQAHTHTRTHTQTPQQPPRPTLRRGPKRGAGTGPEAERTWAPPRGGADAASRTLAAAPGSEAAAAALVRAQRSPAGAIAERAPAAPAAPWWRRRPPGPGRCGEPSWYPRSSLWTSTISRGPRQRPAWLGCCGPRSGAQVPAGGRQVLGAGLGGRDRGNNSLGRRGPWTSGLAARPGPWTLVAQ